MYQMKKSKIEQAIRDRNYEIEVFKTELLGKKNEAVGNYQTQINMQINNFTNDQKNEREDVMIQDQQNMRAILDDKIKDKQQQIWNQYDLLEQRMR